MEEIEKFDVVALVADDARSKMKAGDEGTVLEFMLDGALEIEFTNEEGETLHIGYYAAADVLRVWSAKTGQFVGAGTGELVAA